MSANLAHMSTNFKKKVAVAAGWSAVHGWAIKFLGVLLFLVLARFLSPAEMGLAQSITLALAFIGVVAEQGFHRALVQRPTLERDDVNLPFYLSVAVGLVASLLLWLFADEAAALLGEPAAAPLIRYASVIPPITAATGILVAMSRRELDFRAIAHAALVASVISCLVALVLAVLGYGALSVVVQAIVSVAITALMMWRVPVWRPTLRIETRQFSAIFSFSTMSFGSQLIDFLSRRLIDFIILSRHGVAALGVYAVGAKLYLTLLELLVATLVEVSLSAFSRLSSDIVRLRAAYLRLVFIASCVALPVFIWIATVAPEICVTLFGPKWSDAIVVTQLLCLLGALEVVQLFNIGVIGASGRARTLLAINIIRLVVGAAVLMAFENISIQRLTAVYVLSQLLVVPISFRQAMRVVEVSAWPVLRQILPGAFAATLAAAAVFSLRAEDLLDGRSVLINGFIYSMLFVSVYVIVVVSLCRRRLIDEWRYIESSYRK